MSFKIDEEELAKVIAENELVINHKDYYRSLARAVNAWLQPQIEAALSRGRADGLRKGKLLWRSNR